MTFFPDLSAVGEALNGRRTQAVGWLAAGHGYERGPVPRPFIKKLKSLCARWPESTEALAWPVAAGAHTCELRFLFIPCLARAAGNIGIPNGDVLYMAPEMIGHYCSAHGYLPPPEFIAAVMDCPAFGSEAYRQLVARFRRAASD